MYHNDYNVPLSHVLVPIMVIVYVLLIVNFDQVFTTIALVNMLIAPLNAFPWVLNGLMEAWVSIKRVQKLLDVSIK